MTCFVWIEAGGEDWLGINWTGRLVVKIPLLKDQMHFALKRLAETALEECDARGIPVGDSFFLKACITLMEPEKTKDKYKGWLLPARIGQESLVWEETHKLPRKGDKANG